MPNISIVPNPSKVARAYNFNNSPIWVGLGRTTPWDIESDPPAPSQDVSTLDEPLIYKKATLVTFVTEDPTGSISIYRNGSLVYFRAITPEEAIEDGVSSIFIECKFFPEDLPDDTTYRQVGIFSYLTPETGYEDEDTLYPDEVADVGFLEWISHQEPVYIQPNQINTIQMVITF